MTAPQNIDMLNQILSTLQFQSQALTLRSARQTVLASNIANTDTPGYKARDFALPEALAKATGLPTRSLQPLPAGTGQDALTMSTTSLSAARASAATTVPAARLQVSDARHLPGKAGAQLYASNERLQYRRPDQASMDGNTVELDRERANFADNALHYEAALRFINGSVRTNLSAIKGE
ncbi:MAG: flagellar basal body protein [Burkholderiaceae bacterium]